MSTVVTSSAAIPVRRTRLSRIAARPAMLVGTLILCAVVGAALLAPCLWTVDPQAISPIRRLRWPSDTAWFGTDMLGRDVYSRVVFGAQVSLLCGASVAILASTIGLAIGLLAGFNKLADRIVMRIMDGLMAIPPVLIAIAFMALTKASLSNVVIAITIAEVPRVARLTRALALGLREQLYVEAARSYGLPTILIVWRHILPNCLAPLSVQATFIAASAIVTEAILSFVGAGTPSNIPTWGNMMAEARDVVQVAPYILLAPGLALSATVLAINLIGDGVRDMLDPTMRASL
jgi:peptide/nickel transport system permease protein